GGQGRPLRAQRSSLGGRRGRAPLPLLGALGEQPLEELPVREERHVREEHLPVALEVQELLAEEEGAAVEVAADRAVLGDAAVEPALLAEPPEPRAPRAPPHDLPLGLRDLALDGGDEGGEAHLAEGARSRDKRGKLTERPKPTFPGPQRGQERTSASNARRMRSAHARYFGRARSGFASARSSSAGGERGHGSTALASGSARATTSRRHGAFGARTP